MMETENRRSKASVSRRIAFAVPGDLATATGGYIYDRRIIAGLQEQGWIVDLIRLGDGFPKPEPQVLTHAQDVLLRLEPGCPLVIDGLAFAVMPEAAEWLARRHPLIALVHHPLALETGLSPAQAELFKASEIAALVHARQVIVTSQATANDLIRDFAVAPERIAVVCPGTDRGQLATGSSDGVLRLLSVGSIVPRKGFDVLVAALSMLKDLPWNLKIAGDRTRDILAAAQLDKDLVHFALTERITLLGAVTHEALENLYLNADLFVLASRFEGYGMAYAEALAHGLPVVGTTAGAIPDTVPPGAGVLVEPDQVEQLADVLRQIMTDPVFRARLSRGALEAAAAQPSWQQSAGAFAKVLEAFT